MKIYTRLSDRTLSVTNTKTWHVHSMALDEALPFIANLFGSRGDLRQAEVHEDGTVYCFSCHPELCDVIRWNKTWLLMRIGPRANEWDRTLLCGGGEASTPLSRSVIMADPVVSALCEAREVTEIVFADGHVVDFSCCDDDKVDISLMDGSDRCVSVKVAPAPEIPPAERVQ